MSDKFDLSIDISNEEFKKIREILINDSLNGLRHFILEIKDEKLHVVEYSEYQKLEKENEKLKKQLEECYCNRIDCSGRIKHNEKYDNLVQKMENQQQEFIKYLEDEIKKLEEVQATSLEEKTGKYYFIAVKKEILSKYKEVIGGVEYEK